MAQAQDRAAGSAKPYFYGAGRILGRVSRLYGYSLLLSGITSLFVTGFSSLPLTKWEDGEGVPRADVVLVSVLLKLWIAMAVSTRAAECVTIQLLPGSESGTPQRDERKLTMSKNLSPSQLVSSHLQPRSTSRQQTRS